MCKHDKHRTGIQLLAASVLPYSPVPLPFQLKRGKASLPCTPFLSFLHGTTLLSLGISFFFPYSLYVCTFRAPSFKIAAAIFPCPFSLQCLTLPPITSPLLIQSSPSLSSNKWLSQAVKSPVRTCLIAHFRHVIVLLNLLRVKATCSRRLYLTYFIVCLIIALSCPPLC
jgi:hypothetical protein